MEILSQLQKCIFLPKNKEKKGKQIYLNDGVTNIAEKEAKAILKGTQKLEGLPGGSDGKESTCNVGDLGSIPVSGRSPGEGNGYPLQYSCLENPINKGACWATVHGVTKCQT